MTASASHDSKSTKSKAPPRKISAIVDRAPSPLPLQAFHCSFYVNTKLPRNGVHRGAGMRKCCVIAQQLLLVRQILEYTHVGMRPGLVTGLRSICGTA